MLENRVVVSRSWGWEVDMVTKVHKGTSGGDGNVLIVVVVV